MSGVVETIGPEQIADPLCRLQSHPGISYVSGIPMPAAIYVEYACTQFDSFNSLPRQRSARISEPPMIAL